MWTSILLLLCYFLCKSVHFKHNIAIIIIIIIIFICKGFRISPLFAWFHFCVNQKQKKSVLLLCVKRILHVHHELKHYSCETNSNNNNNNNKIKILLILLLFCAHTHTHITRETNKFMALILILWLYSVFSFSNKLQPMF